VKMSILTSGNDRGRPVMTFAIIWYTLDRSSFSGCTFDGVMTSTTCYITVAMLLGVFIGINFQYPPNTLGVRNSKKGQCYHLPIFIISSPTEFGSDGSNRSAPIRVLPRSQKKNARDEKPPITKFFGVAPFPSYYVKLDLRPFQTR
jgi:hypothetical protein